MGRKRRTPKRTRPIQIGWVVRARVGVKKKQWYSKEQEFRVIEVFTIKTLSNNFMSPGAADAYADIARKDPKYISVWVTENYGEEEYTPTIPGAEHGI